jgi:formate C-acetyltransferase
MSKVTIKDEDLSLGHITYDTLPRLKRLRDLHFKFKEKPPVCIELPTNITNYMKQLDDPADSPELRAGKLYKYVLENKKAIIADENLLAGTSTTKPVGVLLYPDLLALTLWPELETVSTRPKNPFGITREEIDKLNFDIFPYWLERGTVMEVTRKDFGYPQCQSILERLVFFVATKVYCISHTIPQYGLVVERGLNDLIGEAQERELSLGNSDEDKAKKDFYQAVQKALSGIITYAEKLSRKAAAKAEKENDPQRRQELLKMSEVCQRVPAEKPRTFQEALNAIWICKIALHQENINAALSLGRLDQILYPFFAQDRKNGLTLEEAVELVGCFWLKIADHVPVNNEMGEELFGGTGSNQAITLGGVDREGHDAVNDLTYVMLKATELLQLRDPNVNARYHPEIHSIKPRHYLERLCQVNIKTTATPCFHNDFSAIEALRGQGVSLEDARDYGIVGCVEPTSSGRTFGHTGCLLVNLPAALEMALFEGKHRLTGDEQMGPLTKPAVAMNSFAELKEALETQMTWLIDQAVTMNNYLGRTYQKIHPFPMLSAMMEGCLPKGKDVVYGGATYNSSGAAIIGLAEVVDSVTAIEEFVFNQKKLSMATLMAALQNNWGDPYKRYQAMILASPEKYGQHSPMATTNAHWLMDFLHKSFQIRENYRGGVYTVGYWSMTNHAGFGALTGALPSGREKGEAFASGITPVSGSAPDLPSCLNFVAALDYKKIANGQALNLKYTPATTTLVRFADTIEAFFKMGGLQVQFNIIDRKTLEGYRQHPETCPRDLLVRVSGYTAYFKDLNPLMQQEIITRAEYDLATGQEQGF